VHALNPINYDYCLLPAATLTTYNFFPQTGGKLSKNHIFGEKLKICRSREIARLTNRVTGGQPLCSSTINPNGYSSAEKSQVCP
jgi:hypothetical protein